MPFIATKNPPIRATVCTQFGRNCVENVYELPDLIYFTSGIISSNRTVRLLLMHSPYSDLEERLGWF